MSTIPASYDVTVNPEVLAAAAASAGLNGLMLTTNTRVPIGQVLSFPTKDAVSAYFGPSSFEYSRATIYFGGFDGSDVKPGALLFAQYPTAPVAAYLRGGSLAAMTLTQLQALSGTLSITVDGVVETSSTITLSGDASFSAAAATILAAFTSPNFTVSYDSVSSAFIFTTTATGATATMGFATGTLAASLNLTQANGAVTSQGAAAATPAAFMTSLIGITQNWASFMTLFDPDNGSGNAEKQAFATWNGQQNNRYAYVCWDTDVTPTESTSATGSLGYLLAQAKTSGTILVWEPSEMGHASFILGFAPSLDFTREAGRATLKFKGQSGLQPAVTDATTAANLEANGYNFYGVYATGSQQWTYMAPGAISGQYKWANSYYHQVWLDQEFTGDMMILLTQVKSIPYGTAGDVMIEAALADTIKAAGNFGVFQPGVTLSALQISEVNTAAGAKIDTVLAARGWYLQVLPGTPAQRQARTSPPCTFWYVDGGDVQKLNLASVALQ